MTYLPKELDDRAKRLEEQFCLLCNPASKLLQASLDIAVQNSHLERGSEVPFNKNYEYWTISLRFQRETIFNVEIALKQER